MTDRVERDGGRVVLYWGDCLEVLPTLAAGSVDAVVTDPPYGGNLGTHGAANETRPQYLAKAGYANYDDTPENFEAVVVPAVRLAIERFGRGLVFCAGTQAWSLPRPAAVGGVFLPAGCGRSRWGFQCLAHFLLYGDCPSLNLGAKPTAFKSTERADESEHPCPKPVGWMIRCVNLASLPDETILDPFNGAGTTGVGTTGVGTTGFAGVAGAHAMATTASTSTKMDMMTNDLCFNTSGSTSLNYNLLVCTSARISCKCKNTLNNWVSQVF